MTIRNGFKTIKNNKLPTTELPITIGFTVQTVTIKTDR